MSIRKRSNYFHEKKTNAIFFAKWLDLVEIWSEILITRHYWINYTESLSEDICNFSLSTLHAKMCNFNFWKVNHKSHLGKRNCNHFYMTVNKRLSTCHLRTFEQQNAPKVKFFPFTHFHLFVVYVNSFVIN